MNFLASTTTYKVNKRETLLVQACLCPWLETFVDAGVEEVASSAGRRQNTQRTESFYNVCTIYGLQGRRALLYGKRVLSERVNNLFWQISTSAPSHWLQKTLNCNGYFRRNVEQGRSPLRLWIYGQSCVQLKAKVVKIALFTPTMGMSRVVTVTGKSLNSCFRNFCLGHTKADKK